MFVTSRHTVFTYAFHKMLTARVKLYFDKESKCGIIKLGSLIEQMCSMIGNYQMVGGYVHTHKVNTEVVCFVCDKNTEHLIEYANGSIKSITCGACGVKYELIIEVSIHYHTANVLHRVLTKPRRLLGETRDGLIKFIYSLPLRIVSKPYRLANEIIVEPGQSIEGSKIIETDIFCSSCSEVTRHNLYYYDDKIKHSVCTCCGLKIELLCLVVKYKNYPEELMHRLATKPERILKELHSRRSSILYSIPIRVVTKPYRLFREFINRMKKNPPK